MNIGNLSSYLPKLKPRTIESAAPARFRQYEYDGRGLMKQRLLPKQQDELNAKLAEAAKVRDLAIDAASASRETRLKEIRATYEAARATIENDHRQAQVAANATFEEIEDRLHGEYAAPLSPEQVALFTARPGEVVRVPAQANGGGQ